MNYFPLLSLLPGDLVHMIYLIILKERCVNKIFRVYKLRFKKYRSLKYLINNTFCNEFYDYNETIQHNVMISQENIDLLRVVCYNDYTNVYDRFFWQNLLGLMSSKLMHIYTGILMSNLNNNKNSCYRNLNKGVVLWFILCQKYNIRLRLFYIVKGVRNVDCREVSTRKILHIKNFCKFLYRPNVLFDDGINYVVDYDAYRVIRSYL